MAESYCLKSCSECGQCSGCRGGSYASRCEITKCCKEKNHEDCESCTRAPVCTLRAGRDQMPGKLHDQDRREAEAKQANRAKAAVLARWTNVVFLCVIIRFAMGIVSNLPMQEWIIQAVSTVFGLGICFGYLRMKEADHGFAAVAGMELAVLAGSALASFFPDDSWPSVILNIIIVVVAVFEARKKSWVFRDTLSGISAEHSEKWENQWKLYRLSLILMLGGVLLAVIPVIGFVALLGMVAGIGILLFVTIRECVYLYQTVQVCRVFGEMEN